MPKILSFNLYKEKDNETPFGIILDSFKSLDRFTKITVITLLLIIFATPFIVGNLLIFNPKAQEKTRGDVALQSQDVREEKQRQHFEKQNSVRIATDLLDIHGKTIKNNIKKKAEFQKQLVEISKQRKQDLIFLLKNDAKIAKELILSDDILSTLNTIEGIELEQKVDLSGSYTIFHQDNKTDPTQNTFIPTLITIEGNSYFLYSDKDISIREPGTLTVSGYSLDNNIIVDSVKINDTKVLGSNTTTGDLPTAVILVNYSDTTIPLDMSKVQALYQGTPGKDLSSYVNESSYGKANIKPQFFGPYNMPYAKSECNSRLNEVYTTANPDIDYTQFKRIALIRDCGGNWSQMIEYNWSSPDGPVVLTAYAVGGGDAPYSLDTTAHELMHTLGNAQGDGRGNNHSSQMVCLPDAFRTPTNFNNELDAIARCPIYTYGDFTDNLGGNKPPNNGSDAIGHPNATHKYQAGWFGTDNYIVANNPGTFTYTIAPLESASLSPQAIFIPRDGTTLDNSYTYWTIEYRQPIGFDYWLTNNKIRCIDCNIDKGAAIRLKLSNFRGDVLGIDTTPGSIDNKHPYRFDDFHDSSLLPGQTFTDPEYGYIIKTISADSNGLTLQVTIPGSSCTRVVPTYSISPSTQTVSTPQPAIHTVTVTNNDSVGCPSGIFRIRSGGTGGGGVRGDDWIYDINPTFLTISPGASGTTQLIATPPNSLIDGTYHIPYIVNSSVIGIYGNFQDASYILSSASDNIPPSAPTNFQAVAVGSKQINLTWSSATDNLDLAGYRIYRDGVELYNNRLPTSKNTFYDYNVLSGQTYTYTVRALDRKNNISPDSNSVTVKTLPLTDTQAPSRIQQFSISAINANAVNLSWSASSDNVAIGRYQIADFRGFGVNVPPAETNLTLYGLLDSSYKQYAVLAYDVNGNTTSWVFSSITTPFPGTLPPTRPENFTANPVGPNRIDLSWTASTDDVKVVGYNIYRNYAGTGTSYVQLFKSATVASNSYSDTNVWGNTSYDYYIEAFDDVGNLSSPSIKILSVKTPQGEGTPVPLPTNPPTSIPTSTPITTPTPTRTPTPTPISSDTTAPSVSIASPSNNSTVTKNATIAIIAIAADNIGVARVEFSVNGVIKCTDTISPYSCTWKAPAAKGKSYSLTAKAYDASNNTGSSSIVTVTAQ